jgi:hypothetical protein
MKKLIIILAIGGMLSGCAQTQYTWTKPDLNYQDFNRDKYQCYQGSLVATNQVLQGSVWEQWAQQEYLNRQFKDLFSMCMTGHGYTLQVIPK